MKNMRRFPRVITKDQLIIILETIAKSPLYTVRRAGPFLRLRDATLQCFLFYTGLRPNEALTLKWKDLDFVKRTIEINPESNKERNGMPGILTKPAIEYIDIYKIELEKLGIGSEWVFPSLWTWRPMTTDAMGKRFQAIAKEAGLQKIEYYNELGRPKYELSPYGYRRSFATEVYEKTNDTFAVMQMLRLLRPTSVPSYVLYSDKTRVKVADRVFA